MKKLLSLIVASAVMCTALLTGCGAAATDESSSNGGSDGSITVGAIYINSQNDTAGYTYAHHKGITTAMENLGLSTDTNLKIIDNVPEDDEQVRTAIEQLAGQGCNIIFGISFGYLNAFAEAAEEYPDIVFCHATGYLSNDTNFNNYFGRIYQARYLSGIAAGYKSLEISNNNIGYVSVFSLSEVSDSVTIKGLKYELEDERLNNAFPLGVSNEFVGKPAYIDVRNGTLLITWSKGESTGKGQ